MLISTFSRFIVLSPTKVASSTVSALLGEFCDIAIGDAQFGKHDRITEVVKRYQWIFDVTPFKDFKVFLLLRDPIERAVSLYASHQKPEFDGRETSTKGLSPADFVEKWLPDQAWMSDPQFIHGLLADRGFSVDYIIRNSNLAEDIQGAMAMVDVKVDMGKLSRLNSSPDLANKDDVHAYLRKRLVDYYAVDKFLADGYSGRPLKANDKTAIFKKIQQVYGNHFNVSEITRSVREGLGYC